MDHHYLLRSLSLPDDFISFHYQTWRYQDLGSKVHACSDAEWSNKQMEEVLRMKFIATEQLSRGILERAMLLIACTNTSHFPL